MMPVWIKERAKSLETNLKKNKNSKFKRAIQYKYKGDNCYLSFHERLCRSNQNEINRIIESAFWQADNNTGVNLKYITNLCKFAV